MKKLLNFCFNPKHKITPLQINIYGNSAAGKTTFLYQIIKQLKDRSIGLPDRVDFNDNADRFYEQLSKRIEERGDNYIATSGDDIVENIVIKIRNDFFSPDGTSLLIIQSWPPNRLVEFIFQDIEGERIREIINTAPHDAIAWDKVNNLLRSCAFFLCFFDPTHSDSKEHEENLTEFYDGEHKRVKELIDRIPVLRPRDPLPILFIQTHKDILDNKDSEIQVRASAWFDRVYKDLQKSYGNHRKGYGKDPNGNINVPAEVLDRDENFLLIASKKQGEVFAPVKRLGIIQDAVRPQIVNPPISILDFLASPKTRIAIVLIGLIIISAIGLKYYLDEKREIKEVASQREKNAEEFIDVINKHITALKGISTDKKPSPNTIVESHRLLHDTFANLSEGRSGNYVEAKRTSINEACDSLKNELSETIERIVTACCDDNSEDHDRKIELVRILADLKKNELESLSLGDRKSIGEALKKTWDLVKLQTAKELKQSIASIRKVPSTLPVDDLKIIRDCLMENRARWEDLQRQIPDSEGSMFILEINDVIKFCDDCLEKKYIRFPRRGFQVKYMAWGHTLPSLRSINATMQEQPIKRK